jgi:hypothetical protein
MSNLILTPSMNCIYWVHFKTLEVPTRSHFSDMAIQLKYIRAVRWKSPDVSENNVTSIFIIVE